MKNFTKEQVLEAHKHYEFDTYKEGKFSSNAESFYRIKGICNLVPSQSIVLEIGCNSGGLLNKLYKEKNIVPVGVDICESLVKRAINKGVIAKVSDAEKLPFKDNFFDICIMSEVLEHLFDDKKCLKEASRVLKAQGTIIVTVPHPKGFSVKKRPLDKHKWHIRNYTKKELKSKLNKNFKNVVIEDIYGLSYNAYDKDKLFSKPRWMLGQGVKK